MSAPIRKSNKKMRWVWLALGISIVATLAIYMSGQWSIEKIKVSGNQFTDTEVIVKRANITTGTHPDSLKSMEIIQSVEKLPYVAKATLIHEPPSSMRIDIEERMPIGLLADGPEKVYIDKNGVKLPVITGKAVNVPLLFGFSTSFSDTLSGQDFTAASEFLALCNKDPILNATVSEVIVNDSEGIVALSQENGVKLVFGRSNLKQKANLWKSFQAEVIRSEGMQTFASIDFRYQHQIVVRKS